MSYGNYLADMYAGIDAGIKKCVEYFAINEKYSNFAVYFP